MQSVSVSFSYANVTERRTDWNAINWHKAYRIVRNLRRRIFRASIEEASDLLELCEGKLSCAVLRGRRISDDPLLPGRRIARRVNIKQRQHTEGTLPLCGMCGGYAFFTT